MERITLAVTDLKILGDFFGEKTINELRREHGLTDVVGGDQGYVDWLKSNSNVLPPQLTIVANPFMDGMKS